MSSPAQVAANRRNAQHSTGPKTPEGRATSALNALRHGILSRVAVLPGVEDPGEWADHLQAVREDLRPEGYLEGFMAERIAAILWRMTRASRWERDVVAISIEELEDSKEDRTKDHLEELQVRLARAKSFLPGTFEDKILMDPGDAWALIAEAYEVIGEGPEDDEESECFERTWTTGEMREYLAGIADDADDRTTGEELRGKIQSDLEYAIRRCQMNSELEARKGDRERRRSILPADGEAEKLLRYEGALERSLYRSMREFFRLKNAQAVDVTNGFVSKKGKSK